MRESSEKDIQNHMLWDNGFSLELMLHSIYMSYMECIGKSITSIHRPNNYLLAALYNAPVTTDLYYAMQVKHDLHNYPDG